MVNALNRIMNMTEETGAMNFQHGARIGMRNSTHLALGLITGWLAWESSAGAEEIVRGRRSLVMNTPVARLVLDLAGGSFAEFQLSDRPLNPLQWAAPPADDTAPRAFGHFLCLDRWGPPSDAEAARGMPFHGEATHVEWKAWRDGADQGEWIETEMAATLPMAGLAIRRTVRLAKSTALFTVREEITNQNKLGRVFNGVQHPTIAPPFLDETTIVDANGRQGFAQGGSLTEPAKPSFDWPNALSRDGVGVNMRRLESDPNPNVVSYCIDDEWGWVTAATPSRGLLIGYFWRTKDYPWLNLWRDVRNGKPAARGLEFGTTGLHQPFAILIRQGRIFGRPLFEYLDAGEAVAKSYGCFLCRIPSDYTGVGSLKVDRDHLTLRERRDAEPREIRVSLGGLALP